MTRDELATAIESIRADHRQVFEQLSHQVRAQIAAIPAPAAGRDEGVFNVMVSSFGVLGYALSARALLLLALLGAFAIAVMAMLNQGTMSLLILAAYSLSTVVPVTVLEIRKTRE